MVMGLSDDLTESSRPRRENITRRIYELAVQQGFIDLHQASEFAGYAQARAALWRLAGRGQLSKIKDGLYAGIPPGQNAEDYEVDRYLLAYWLSSRSGTLAFHSALELHGVANSVFYRVTYFSPSRLKPFEFQDILYSQVSYKSIFGTVPMYRGGIIMVTDQERTFLDCLRRIQLSGGFEEVFKSVEGFAMLDSKRMWDYLLRFDEPALFSRTGYVLTLLDGKVRFDESLLENIRTKVGNRPSHLMPGGRGIAHSVDKEWNLLVPENIEELLKQV
jgi:predicted transcriptional regulator of viral defense system